MTQWSKSTDRPLFVTVAALDGLIVAQMKHNPLKNTQESLSIQSYADKCQELQHWASVGVPVFDFRLASEEIAHSASHLLYQYSRYQYWTSDLISELRRLGMPEYRPVSQEAQNVI